MVSFPMKNTSRKLLVPLIILALGIAIVSTAGAVDDRGWNFDNNAYSHDSNHWDKDGHDSNQWIMGHDFNSGYHGYYWSFSYKPFYWYKPYYCYYPYYNWYYPSWYYYPYRY
jgi:hypothetical protein